MKCFTRRDQVSVWLLVLATCLFVSCSGLPKTSSGGSSGGSGGGGGGTGTKTLTVSMIAGPEFVQSSFTILAFTAQITSLVLNETSGSTIPLKLAQTPYPVDFNRLTTDSALVITSDTLPITTPTSSMTMAVQNISVTIANGPTAIGSCAANAVCQFTAPPAVTTITAQLFPGALAPGSDGKLNIYLSVRAQDIVTAGSSGIQITFSLANSNTVSGAFLPRKGSTSAIGLELVQDFTGVVTAVSANSVTVTSGSGVAVTAALNSSTTLDVPQSTLCSAKTVAACVIQGAVVSLDAAMASGGALTATEIDLLDPAVVDSIEGTIYSVGGSFFLVVTDKQVVSTNTTLMGANIGDVFAVTLAPAATFVVDTKNLTTASPPVPVNLFASSADILGGQTVRLHVTAASGSKATNDQALTAGQVQLRFSRVTATASPSSTPVIVVSNFNQIFKVSGTPIQAQTYSGITTYDNGITSNSDIGGVGTSNLVSMRALLLKGQPNFFVTTIRDQ